LGKKVPKGESGKYGCLAIEETTLEVLHYAEKPETYVSDIINCGVYLFSPSIYDLLTSVSESQKPQTERDPHFLQLEQDVFMRYCGEKHVYVYETKAFWLQVKSAGIVVKCSEELLHQLKEHNSPELAKNGDGKTAPIIVGNVLIHPTATIHPTAKLGPNVAIGAGVIVGAGVRILNSIVLERAEIKSHACIVYSIIGWNSTVGQWARIEGLPDYSVDVPGITILGTGVTIAPEIIVRSSIILPHKDLGTDTKNSIIL